MIEMNSKSEEVKKESTDDDQEEDNKKKGRKVEFEEKDIIHLLDNLEYLLEKQIIYVISKPMGLGYGLKSRKLEKEFSISRDIANKSLSFILNYCRSILTQSIEDFIELFQEEEIEKTQKMIKIIEEHPNSKQLAFRVQRKCNFPIEEIQCNRKSVEINFQNSNELINYYDITIPYINQEGREDTIRLEIDKTELANLIDRLTKSINQEDRTNG